MSTRRLCLTFFLVLWVPVTLSTAWFVISPRSFYWRPWEYFDQVAYVDSLYPIRWDGSELPDLSRQSFFFRQTARTTAVSTDRDGHRAVPLAGPPAILFLGDSLVFGSGLSDDETVPWIAAEKTGLPTFNAARREFNLAGVLANPRMRCVQLVIETATERVVEPQYIPPFGNPAWPMNTLSRSADPLLFLTLEPRQFLLPALVGNVLRRLKFDAILVTDGNVEAFLQPTRFGDGQIASVRIAAADAIAQKAAAVRSRGINYLYIGLPSSGNTRLPDGDRLSVAAYEAAHDPAIRERYEREHFLPLLDHDLKKRGVDSVDMLTPFREAIASGQDPFSLYDTHWNPYGARLATEVILAYAREKRLVDVTTYHRCVAAGA